MNETPIRSFLASFFSTLLKAFGGAFVAHHLVTPDAAQGLLSYSDALAGLVLIGAGQIITWLKSEKAASEIYHLKLIIETRLKMLDSQVDHAAEAKAFSIPILSTTQNQTQPTNPKS